MKKIVGKFKKEDINGKNGPLNIYKFLIKDVLTYDEVTTVYIVDENDMRYLVIPHEEYLIYK